MRSLGLLAQLPLAAILLLLGCGSDAPPEGASRSGSAPAVVVGEVQQKNVPLYVEYVARTEAIEAVEIRARVEGVLEQAHFREGSVVAKGQKLFTIEQGPYQAALQDARAKKARAEADLYLAEKQVELIKAKAGLAQAEASYAKAAQDVERLKPLAAEAAVPAQELDAAVAAEAVARAEVEAAKATVQNTELSTQTYIVQAKAAVETASAALTQAELAFSYTEIHSPISGQIGRRHIDPGNLVGKGEATLLATVSANNPMKATFGMSETDYLALTKRILSEGGNLRSPSGERIVEMLLSDDTIFPHKGHFTAIENVIDLQTGTLTIETQFPNPELLLRPGQFARVRFPVKLLQDALLVPKRAILRVQGIDSVYKVSSDNKVSLHTVAIEAEYEEFAIAASGVDPGDRIVIDGHQKVRPGMAITPTERSAAAVAERE
jgi:membrane fusion protein (multidrug efflux system)